MWFYETPIAHRGYHSGKTVPENSLSAFRLAIAKKIPIELDIIYHPKLDEIFVFHDEKLNRVCGVDKEIYELSLSEIENLRLFNTSEHIPTLKEVLDLVDKQVPILIEVKANNFNDHYGIALRKNLDKYKGKIAIQSFNPRVLSWLKKNFSRVKRGLLLCEFDELKMSFKKIVLKNILMFPSSSPHFLAVDKNALNMNSFKLLRRLISIPILCWTITSKEEFRSYRSYIDNIIFEGFDPYE